MSSQIQKSSSLFKTARKVYIDGFERGLGEIDLSHFILKWSNLNPLDRLWRDKHGIAFNSQEHRKLTIIDLLIELAQSNMIERVIEFQQRHSQPYTANAGKYFKKKSKVEILSQSEIDDAFDNIDISNIEEDADGNLIL